jgi:lipopolysaccharide transport system ATP-binding protein
VNVWALADINFEAERGEVLELLGKNGAGKSFIQDYQSYRS